MTPNEFSRIPRFVEYCQEYEESSWHAKSTRAAHAMLWILMKQPGNLVFLTLKLL